MSSVVPESRPLLDVRDGQRVWPSCPECGCRVFYHRLWGVEYLAHKLTTMERDSQEHKCNLIGSWWRVAKHHKEMMNIGV